METQSQQTLPPPEQPTNPHSPPPNPKKQQIPKGCFHPDLLPMYINVKNFLAITDMYSIVAPFRYPFLSYVVVRTRDEVQGDVLDLYHQVSRRRILRAVVKGRQIGCKFLVYEAEKYAIQARVRGDFMGNKVFVFDGGYNPSKKKFPSRKQLAYVQFSNSQFFSQKPAGMTAILANHTKRIQQDDQIQKLGTLYQAEGIIQLQQSTSQLLKASKQISKRVFTVASVQPVFCPLKKCYVIDLKGLITEPSPINMVVKTMGNQECLVMGKRSPNTYSLYVGSPLTLVQAFGLFLANYSVKKE